jgi:hypothetical protein
MAKINFVLDKKDRNAPLKVNLWSYRLPGSAELL